MIRPDLFDMDPQERAIAEEIASDPYQGNPEAGMQAEAAQWGGDGASLPTASPDVVAQALQRNVTPQAPPQESDRPWIQAERSQAPQSAVGNVDPGLAFFAAFSQNPVLQKMVEESRNRPRVQAEFERQQAQDSRAQEKWQQERDIMNPLKAGKLQNENALGASRLEAKDPKSAYSNAHRQALAQALGLQAQRLASIGSPLAAEMQRAARDMVSNANLSAEQAEAMVKIFGAHGDKAVSEARNAALDAEKMRMGEAQREHMSEQDKQGWARIAALRERALKPRQSARERAVNAKAQEKLDDEIEKADWAKNMLLRAADLKKNVNTGPLAGRAQNILQSVDMSSDDFNNLKQTLAQVSNRIIKELSGSAVTGNEWMRMQDELANIMNDDRNFATKLANMIELTESIKQRAINRYSRVDGAPVNPTNTAARVTNQTPQTMPGETAPPNATPGMTMKAPPGKAPGSIIRQKSTGKTFRVTQDGMLEEVK